MRRARLILVGCVLWMVSACSGKSGGKPSCDTNPDDPKCNLPQCMNGIDDDGDGKTDYPDDPGCFSPNQDTETDDCPTGTDCPECGNGKDDDNNGSTDYAGGDMGCFAASDTDEFTEDPYACGPQMVEHLPWNNEVMGSFAGGMSSSLHGACGGSGSVHVFLLRLKEPKVVVATTDTAGTTADTVLYIRSSNCQDQSGELACSDDLNATDNHSTVTAALQPGTYYLILQAHDSSVSGMYDLQVHFYVGEGTACQTGDDCGPGLVCRVPTGGSTKVCAKHVCQDGVDDDGDGKLDYPTDPGCDSPTDDDETDDCPSGPNCPECGNGIDDNGNSKTDYPAEPNCLAASSSSEWCATHESVVRVTQAMTSGDTTSAVSDYQPTCAVGTGVPDLTYQLDVPALDSLTVTADTGGSWFPDVVLLNNTCAGTALQCAYSTFTSTNVTAGRYFVIVDGEDTTDHGAFTLTVAGKIKNNSSCESALALSGALTCNLGYACKGMMGSRTCQPAACSDGVDNNGDMKIDWPNDPGCSGPGDDTEDTVCPGANCPVCSNMVDDNNNMRQDWPAEWGCVSASGTTEVFCMPEMDPSSQILTKVTTGNTTGKSKDLPASCGSTNSPDVSYALQLPVPVVTMQIDTIGSSFDTTLTLRDANCMTVYGCDDDGGGSLTSKITASNLLAGGYAITVDGFSSSNGAFTLNVHGTVAAGTSCASSLFSGTTPVLSCPTGTTCTGTPKKCQ